MSTLERRWEHVEEIVSEGLRLSAHFARPPGVTRVPALLVLPGFPARRRAARPRSGTPTRRCAIASRARRAGPVSRSRSGAPDRRKATSRSTAGSPTCAPRSTRSTRARDVTGVWIAGLPARRHARDRHRRERRSGARHRDVRRARVAAHVGARARLVPRVRAPHGRAAHARAIRPIPTRGSARSPTSIRSTPRATIAPRPWLLVHGSADDVVPVDDARRLADAAGDVRRSCGSSRTARTACATIPARSPRSSAGSTVRTPERATMLARACGEHGGERLVERVRGVPAGARRAAAIASPTRRGTSTGRTSVGVDGDPQRRASPAATRRSAISRTDTPVPEHTL